MQSSQYFMRRSLVSSILRKNSYIDQLVSAGGRSQIATNFPKYSQIHQRRSFARGYTRMKKIDLPEHPPGPPKELITGPTPEIEQLVDDVLQLTVLEYVELIEVYKRRTGLTDEDYINRCPPIGTSQAANTSAAAEDAKPVKNAYDVKLIGYDEKAKIKVIKEVRTIMGLGLKEAKDMVEGIPKVLKKDLTKEEAEKLVAFFKSIGGECSMD